MTLQAGSRSIQKRDVPAAVERAVLGSADRCCYCSDVLLPRQVDHVRPLSRGGTNRRSNLVAACISCNSQKRGMLLHEWRQWRQANGMSWPPIASHATDPQHYTDTCWDCCDPDAGSMPLHMYAVAPTELKIDRLGGYVAHYQCPRSHRWTCGWAISDEFFGDCSCPWCEAKRLECDEEAWPLQALYESA